MPDLSREEAIAIMQRDRTEVMALVERLSAEQLTRHGLGGGDWSVKELLGHLESWEEHALNALDAWSRHQTAPIHEALSGIGLDAVNATELASKALRSYDEQLASTLETRGRLLAALESIDDSAWVSPPLPDSERTTADLLGSILEGANGPFSHDAAHLPDLRALIEDS